MVAVERSPWGSNWVDLMNQYSYRGKSLTLWTSLDLAAVTGIPSRGSLRTTSITWPASHPIRSTNHKKHHIICIHSHTCGLCPQLGGSPLKQLWEEVEGKGHGEAPPMQDS